MWRLFSARNSLALPSAILSLSAPNFRAQRATWPWAITPTRAEQPIWACCRIACRDTRTSTTRRSRRRSKICGTPSCPPSQDSRRRKWWKRRSLEHLKALYVVGANPLAHFGTLGFGRGKLQLLIVHEMFLTETAKQADIVFPAASAYEKDGSVTNTSGQIQLLHKAG